MRILHFDVVRQLGAGGMGEVYLARDVKLNRRVALKFLPAEVGNDPERLRRFESEARLLASLNHPNIVTIFAVEQQEDRPFLVMEFVDGETLAQKLERKPFKLDEFFDIATALADALAVAHEQGIVHRDLKPSNIMLARDGTPKILDFGLAKLRLGDGDAVPSGATTDPLTREGRVVGTPSFMSPEQLEGRTVDHRSDIFSLGMILYQLATGRRPFEGSTEAEVVSSILRDSPDPADTVQPRLPHHLSRLLRLCLEKSVDHRLQSAHDLRNELLELRRELTTGEILARQPSPLESSRKGNWFGVGAVSLVIALLAVLGLREVWNTSRDAADREEASISSEARDLIHQGYLMEMRGDTRDDLAAAEDRYRRALELEPDQPLIQGRLAMVLARTQMQYPDIERAREIRRLSREVLVARPDLALGHVVEGVLCLVDGDLDGAEEAARRAIDLDPEDYRGYTLLGQALIKQNRTEAGLAELRQGVELAGGDVRARLALAAALNRLRRVNESAAEYEKILDYAPDYPNALNNLAIIYGQTGRDLDAIPLLKTLLRVRRYEAAANNLAMIYMSQGRLKEAIDALVEAYTINPEKPVTLHSLAEAYERAGDLDKSRAWFERAFEAYSRDLEAGGDRSKILGQRAVCAAKLGRFDEAQVDIQAALDLSPRSKSRLFNAAQVFALAGDSEQTYLYVRRAVAGGYSKADFLNDLSFSEFWQRPQFLALLELEAAR